jgi:D-3-phosphoglycerate dehydrogenase
MKIMVTTHPFGEPDSTPKRLLKGHEVFYNTVGRKYTHDELRGQIDRVKPDIIIAGTEKYTPEVLDLMPNLKMISRVGIGMDSIPIEECNRRGVVVTNTPDAPSNAVAELTVCQIINALRRVNEMSESLNNGNWQRFIGRELRECTVGIVGYGRIGKLVYDRLQSFGCKIIVHEIDENVVKRAEKRVEFCSKYDILNFTDIITIHIPRSEENIDFISKGSFGYIEGSIIVNTSRGGIVNEEALAEWLGDEGNIAIVDTFNEEPYKGVLADLPNAYLTPHLGSCTKKSRYDMEVGAVKNALRFIDEF